MDKQRESSAYEMGLHLPYSLDPEVSKKGVVRRMQTGGERHDRHVGGGQRQPRDRRGKRLLRPHPPVSAGSAEAVGQQGDGISEEKERPGAVRPSPGMEKDHRTGQDVLGKGLLCKYGRHQRIDHKEIRERARGCEQDSRIGLSDLGGSAAAAPSQRELRTESPRLRRGIITTTDSPLIPMAGVRSVTLQNISEYAFIQRMAAEFHLLRRIR